MFHSYVLDTNIKGKLENKRKVPVKTPFIRLNNKFHVYKTCTKLPKKLKNFSNIELYFQIAVSRVHICVLRYKRLIQWGSLEKVTIRGRIVKSPQLTTSSIPIQNKFCIDIRCG